MNDDDDELLGALGDALQPPHREPSPDRVAALRADAAASLRDQGQHAPPRRTVLVGSIAAAIGAVVGVAGTAAVTGGSSDDETAAPPTRPVEFSVVPGGTTVAARTIDHSWGMELLLDVDGLPTGRDYLVTYQTSDGPVAAGGFRSVEVPMACRFNGTALRAEVAEVSITDQETGDLILRGTPA